MPQTLERLQSLLEGWVSNFAGTKAKFLADLESRPLHAMEWSGSLFTGTARYEVATYYLDAIKYHRERQEAGAEEPSDDEFLAFIMEEVERKVLNLATSPRCSSSQTANMMSVEELKAYAKIAEYYKKGF